MIGKATGPSGPPRSRTPRFRLERPGASKLVGCLVYLVAGPFVALFLALFATIPLMIASEVYGLSKDFAAGLFVGMLPISLVGVALWGYRDFRRRAALGVTIDPDAIEIALDGRPTAIPVEEVTSIRLEPAWPDFACVLGLRSGHAVRLPSAVASFSDARDALEETLIPHLTHLLSERLGRGESVSLDLSRRRLVGPSLKVCSYLVLLPFLLCNPWRFPVGLQLLGHTTKVIRQIRLGSRGSVILELDGLRSYPGADLVHWKRLESLQGGLTGLVLRSPHGEMFEVSGLIENYWPALRYVTSRVKPGPTVRDVGWDLD